MLSMGRLKVHLRLLVKADLNLVSWVLPPQGRFGPLQPAESAHLGVSWIGRGDGEVNNPASQQRGLTMVVQSCTGLREHSCRSSRAA